MELHEAAAAALSAMRQRIEQARRERAPTPGRTGGRSTSSR